MDFVQYKCPCCGAALTFSPGSQKLSCKSCGNSFDPKTLQQYTEDEQATDKQDIEWNFQQIPLLPIEPMTGITFALPAAPNGSRRRESQYDLPLL